MKIVQINAVYGTGSTGRTTMELHRALKDMGQESYVFTSDGRCEDDGVFPLGTHTDHKIHALFSRLSGKQAYFSAGATKELLKQLDRLKPDVVHLRNLHGNYIHLPMLLDYLSRKDIATVVTLHDCWFFTGKCTHYTTQGCRRWETGCYDCPKLKNDNVSWFFDRTKTLWKDKRRLFQAIPRLGVVGVSDWITDEAKRSFLKTAKVIRRIYNWIDLDVFCPLRQPLREKYGLQKENGVILCVSAAWHETAEKFQDLLKLSRILSPDMRILLVGNVCANVALPEQIINIGYVDTPEKLAELYALADVYVHLSREDTFGKVIAEALACGTPAVVYSSTACPEVVEDGCGYAVPVGDVESVFEAVCRILQNGKSSYIQRCVNSARNRFEKAALIRETTNLYQALAERDT